jgi:hypothetical protein
VADRPPGTCTDSIETGLQRLIGRRRLIGGNRNLLEQVHKRDLLPQVIVSLRGVGEAAPESRLLAEPFFLLCERSSEAA